MGNLVLYEKNFLLDGFLCVGNRSVGIALNVYLCDILGTDTSAEDFLDSGRRCPL
jgi:hypothetical protein